MKKSLLILTIALLSSSFTFAQWGKKVKGNGNMTTETRTVGDYDEIACGGSWNFILVKGKEGEIKLEGEENLLEYISVEVDKGKLRIKTENNVSLKTSSGKDITITISFQEVSSVAMAGSGDMWSEDVIDADEFSAAMAGSGDLKLKVNANSIKGSMAGSGDIQLEGSTNSFKADVAGSGDMHAFNLKSKDVKVSVAGSGDAEVNCTGELKARVAGSGDIKYKGNPTSQDTKVAGSGKISMN